MMRYVILAFILAFSVTFTGCSSAQKKQNIAISRAVYAIQESNRVGRFDISSKLTDELVRIVPPPKKKIKVNAFDVPKSGQKVFDKKGIFSKDNIPVPSDRFVVLPSGFENKPVIVENSAEFDKLVAENKEIQVKEAENQKSVTGFTKEVEKVIAAKEKELAKEKKKSWWGWVLSLVGGLGIIGTIVLLAVFPQLIPIAIGIFGRFVNIVNSLFGAIGGFFKRAPP